MVGRQLPFADVFIIWFNIVFLKRSKRFIVHVVVT